MLNATAARAALGAMILFVAPAMAIIPPSVHIRLGGAEPAGLYSYLVHEADVITMSVSAQPGDLIWAFAVALNENGEANYSVMVTLLFDPDCKSGQTGATIVVPKGLAGRRFQIEAIALSDSGEASWSTSVLVSVAPVDESQVSLVQPTSDL